MTIPEIVVAGVVLVTLAGLIVSTFTAGKLRAHSRAELLGGAADALAASAIGWLLLPWSVVTPWPWLLVVLLAAAGGAGVVLAWGTQPWWRADRPRWPTVVGLVTRALVLAAVVAVVVTSTK